MEANVGKPQVSYKETITNAGKSETKFVKQSGGRGQYAHVDLEIEPNEEGKGNEVVSKIVGGVIPSEYIPARHQRESKKDSPQVFSPVTTWSTSKSRSCSVPTTKWTPTRWPLRSAARWRSKTPAETCKPIILEPIMKVVVTTPEDYMGDVIGDLNRRRGKIQGQETTKVESSSQQRCRLAKCLATRPNSAHLPQDVATYTMEPSHFERVPTKIQEEIMKK